MEATSSATRDVWTRPYEERLEKGRGAGADKTLREFTDSQHSGSYRQLMGVDISQIPVIEDCKGFTSAAFWNRYTVTVAGAISPLERTGHHVLH